MSRTPRGERTLKLAKDMFKHVLAPFDANAADRCITPDYTSTTSASITGWNRSIRFCGRFRSKAPLQRTTSNAPLAMAAM
ncbi:hypothetical protein [Rhizorhapis suberifaciens]|uniref:Putative SnoaL-like aldol condensation-catalyzing enzyme n=1 Tax=Rhizorhapis suberifaciens TaxID=13656 RepID=A0A840HU91_9SPHN|nr:hypothetical protein [Rhizorhapis suberifaciens]MBB4641169.1 putative SnoaL-like aldol condensation-catalyzing enzyme [Rhizorhapis suberifaciens]